MLTFLGCVLLLHATYSSYEHHHIVKTASGIPVDITAELVIGLLCINFGTIKSLRAPYRLSIIEAVRVPPSGTYLEPIRTAQAMLTVNELGIYEHDNLLSRVDFMDIRQKRSSHLSWTQN